MYASDDKSANAKRAAERARIERDLDALSERSRSLTSVQETMLNAQAMTLYELENIAYSMGSSCPASNATMHDRVYEAGTYCEDVFDDQLDAVEHERRALRVKLDEVNRTSKWRESDYNK